MNKTPEVAAAAERVAAEIMNLPCNPQTTSEFERLVWKLGHKDARHAAAELVIQFAVSLRARDEAPIDEAWLRKQLGSPSNESSTVHDWRIGMRTGVISGGYSMVVSCDKSRRLPWRYSVCVVIDGFRRELVYPTTRQQLLNLIAALGGEGRK